MRNKGLKATIAIVLSLGILGSSVPTLGASIAGAAYRGQVAMSNSGYASARNIVPFSMGAQGFLNDLYFRADYSDVVMTDRHNNSVPFMPPSAAGSTWWAWVADIHQNATDNYFLHTGGAVSGGDIVYFPGTGGMTTNNSSSLTIGSSPFRIEMEGWFNSNAVGTYALNKTNAIGWYYDSAGNLSLITSMPATSTVLTGTGTTVGFNATNANMWIAQVFTATESAMLNSVSTWTTNFYGAATARIELFAYTGTASIISGAALAISNTVTLPQNLFGPLEFAFPNPAPIVGGQQYVAVVKPVLYASTTNPTVTTYGYSYSGGSAYTTTNSGGAWTNLGTSLRDFTIKTSQPAPSTPLAVGRHTVALVYTGSSLYWEVDGNITSSIAITGLTIPTNTNPWLALHNNSVPYLVRYRIWVNNTLVQDIAWRDNPTVFADATSYGNHAYPTWITAGTNPNITATLVSFAPINTNPGGSIGGGETGSGAPTITPPPDPPTGTGAHNIVNVPGIGQILYDFFDSHSALVWLYLGIYLLMMIMLTVVVFLTAGMTGDLLPTGIAQLILFGLFVVLGLVPWAVILFSAVAMAFCAVNRRVIQV